MVATLREYIEKASRSGKAVGHFNVATLDMLFAVYEAAQEISHSVGEPVPVIIGTSEGERDFLGLHTIVEVVHGIRDRDSYPIFINADHTYSLERSKEAIDVGYDMVIYDGNNVSHDENLTITKEFVDYANSTNPDVVTEAEFGFIGSGSNIKDEIPDGVSEATMTDPEEARRFVEETGVDLLAPSIGNVHGMVKTGNPSLNPERTRSIRDACGVPLVLHGGSGSSDEDIRSVISAGVSVVHISTEMRLAYRDALRASMTDSDELAPYKYLGSPKQAVYDVVLHHMKLFWGV